jgi:polysaccharide export outer membrane protein
MIFALSVPAFPYGAVTARSHSRAESASTQGSNTGSQDTRPQDPVGSTTGSGAKKPNEPNSVPNASGALITSPEDYRIAANDVIEIRIDKAPEISGMFRVSSSGTVVLNYLGRLTVVNKTPDQLSQSIAEALRGDYLTNPHVVVEVKQYNSRAFFIQGSVRNPGMYYIEGPPSLMKLIIIAGGLADNHGSTAFIIRGLKEEESPGGDAIATSAESESGKGATAKYELIKRNINGLFKGAFDQDLLIAPGDVVNIPSSEVFFVAGEVHAPGSFPLKENTNLRQAITLAQGTTSTAALGRGIIFREDPVSGKRQEINVDIAEAMKGKKGDLLIMPNDTVIVPHSRMKTVGTTFLTVFGFGLVRGAGVPRRF